MATIAEDYVSFEIAKLLKEKGFEGDVNGYYHIWDHGQVCTVQEFSHSEAPHLYIPAPTLQMAMKWLREVHKIDVAIFPQRNGYVFALYNNSGALTLKEMKEYSAYEQATEAAIKYCLENLI